MTRYDQIGWRMAAVAAFAGTAALAVILTRAPVRTDASHAACPTSWLESWLGLGGAPAPASAGDTGPGDSKHRTGTYYTLEFTNVSHRACRLYGYPEVSAYTGSHNAGGQIASAAVPDPSVRPRPVLLAPGATAHSVLQVAGAGGPEPPCVRVTAQELRITLPRQGRAAFVPVHIPLCSGKHLTVQAIQARPGIPGRRMP